MIWVWLDGEVNPRSFTKTELKDFESEPEAKMETQMEIMTKHIEIMTKKSDTATIDTSIATVAESISQAAIKVALQDVAESISQTAIYESIVEQIMTAKMVPVASLTEEEWEKALTIDHQETLTNLHIGNFEAFRRIRKESGNKEKMEVVIKTTTEEHDDFDLPPEIIFHDIGKDLSDKDNTSKLNQILDEILPKIKRHLTDKRKTLIYCTEGISQSIIVVISYIMWTYGVPYDNAFAFVQSRRNQVEVSDNLAKYLQEKYPVSIKEKEPSEEEKEKEWTLGKWVNLMNQPTQFTLDRDAQIVTLANNLASKLRVDPFKLLYTDFDDSIYSSPLYILLKEIPLPQICGRFCILTKFNKMLQSIIRHIDLEDMDGSITSKTDNDHDDAFLLSFSRQLSQVRMLIFSSLKSELFTKILKLTATPPRKNQYLEDQWFTIKVDRTRSRNVQNRKEAFDKYDSLNIKETLFGQFAHQVQVQDMKPQDLRHQIAGQLDEGQARTFKVEFHGEKAADNGGPYRELFNAICGELESEALPLLIPSPNNQFGGELANQGKWLINPACKQNHLYKVFGRLIGISLRCKILLPLNLPSIIWKKLVNETVTLSDFEAIDFTVMELNTVRDMVKENNIESSVVKLILEKIGAKNFTYRLSGGEKIVPLSRYGWKKKITIDNARDWVERAIDARLKECDEQVAAIRSGLSNIVPITICNLFTWKEMETLVCGSPEYEAEDLKKLVKYEGNLNANCPEVKFFWQILEEMTSAERTQFLRFVWARERMPARTTQQFRLGPLSARPSGKAYKVNCSLPESHTCFFQLKIPKYTTKKAMKEKLYYAMYNCLNMDLI